MKPCNDKVFRKGVPVVILDAGAQEAESWVQAIAIKARARVDWHYSGGRAQVLFLGDAAARERVEKAIDDLANMLKGRILNRHPQGGLYRQGVTPIPKGTIAVDPDFGPIAEKLIRIG